MALFLPVFAAALITPRVIQPRTASVRMEVRSGYSNIEDKALRAVRKGFGGYPAGPYYGLPRDAAYDLVRSDHAVLAEWSNDDIEDTVADIKSTPLEILIDTPIGPVPLPVDHRDRAGRRRQPARGHPEALRASLSAYI